MYPVSKNDLRASNAQVSGYPEIRAHGHLVIVRTAFSSTKRRFLDTHKMEVSILTGVKASQYVCAHDGVIPHLDTVEVRLLRYLAERFSEACGRTERRIDLLGKIHPGWRIRSFH